MVWVFFRQIWIYFLIAILFWAFLVPQFKNQIRGRQHDDNSVDGCPKILMMMLMMMMKWIMMKRCAPRNSRSSSWPFAKREKGFSIDFHFRPPPDPIHKSDWISKVGFQKVGISDAAHFVRLFDWATVLHQSPFCRNLHKPKAPATPR